MGKFDIPPMEKPKAPAEKPVAPAQNVNEQEQDLLGEVNQMVEKVNAWKVWVEQESAGKVESGVKDQKESLNRFQIEKQDDGSFSARFSQFSMEVAPNATKESEGVSVSLHFGTEKEETVWEKSFENVEELKRFLPQFLKEKFPDGAMIKNTDNMNM